MLALAHDEFRDYFKVRLHNVVLMAPVSKLEYMREPVLAWMNKYTYDFLYYWTFYVVSYLEIGDQWIMRFVSFVCANNRWVC